MTKTSSGKKKKYENIQTKKNKLSRKQCPKKKSHRVICAGSGIFTIGTLESCSVMISISPFLEVPCDTELSNGASRECLQE